MDNQILKIENRLNEVIQDLNKARNELKKVGFMSLNGIPRLSADMNVSKLSERTKEMIVSGLFDNHLYKRAPTKYQKYTGEGDSLVILHFVDSDSYYPYRVFDNGQIYHINNLQLETYYTILTVKEVEKLKQQILRMLGIRYYLKKSITYVNIKKGITHVKNSIAKLLYKDFVILTDEEKEVIRQEMQVIRNDLTKYKK